MRSAPRRVASECGLKMHPPVKVCPWSAVEAKCENEENSNNCIHLLFSTYFRLVAESQKQWIMLDILFVDFD